MGINGGTILKELEKDIFQHNRKCGVLLHPTSLPSKYGIGDLGSSAYEFVDFLSQSGCKSWQILPLGPTGFGDSPYQSFSSFAGQPLIISPDLLVEAGLILEEEIEIRTWDDRRIDFGEVIEYKYGLLHTAYNNFKSLSPVNTITAFNEFCDDHKYWLDDYALFMAVKDYHEGIVFTEWESEISNAEKEAKEKWAIKLDDEVTFYKFIQFLFFTQWLALKKYANENDIEIIGDTPIFVAFDSADVWSNRELFYLTDEGYPSIVAGVPPDYFSETGQLWGNPIYKWKRHKKTGYAWWTSKIEHTLKLVDVLRIDHFRGFEAYWAVPYGAETAVTGQWKPGPYKNFFKTVRKNLGEDLPIIAEDLGVITKRVKNLRDTFDFPGMRVLQFGFEDEKDNSFMPHNFSNNTVCYTGTHDNDTTLGWYFSQPEKVRDRARRYMNVDDSNIVWEFIRLAIASSADRAIIPMQDLLSLGSEDRMNTPSTLSNNWVFRYTNEMLTEEIKEKLLYLNKLFARC